MSVIEVKSIEELRKKYTNPYGEIRGRSVSENVHAQTMISDIYDTLEYIGGTEAIKPEEIHKEVYEIVLNAFLILVNSNSRFIDGVEGIYSPVKFGEDWATENYNEVKSAKEAGEDSNSIVDKIVEEESERIISRIKHVLEVRKIIEGLDAGHFYGGIEALRKIGNENPSAFVAFKRRFMEAYDKGELGNVNSELNRSEGGEEH